MLEEKKDFQSITDTYSQHFDIEHMCTQKSQFSCTASSPCRGILRLDAAGLRYNMLPKQVTGRLPIASGTETRSAGWPS